MTRFLAFSDIHNNVDCVERMRAQEQNDYDALLIAGDIGDNRANEILNISRSFECPVLYVYGNWDNQQSYNDAGSMPGGLVHLSVYQIGNVSITGFSGCVTHWGKNPAYVDRLESVEQQHAAVIAEYEAIQAETSEHLEAVSNEVDLWVSGELADLTARTKDKRLSSYRQEVRNLELLAELKRDNGRKAHGVRLEEFRVLPRYRVYRQERAAVSKHALEANRAALDEIISRLDAKQSVVMAHERLTRFHERGAAPLLHIFGHRHGFKHTHFMDTEFVNVSALDDRGATVTGDCGGYCVITLSGGRVGVERRELA